MLKKLFLSTAIGFFAFILTFGYAETQAIGPNAYVAGLSRNYVETVANPVSERQQKEYWCWAASAQTLLKLLGYNVSQPQIVSDILGKVVNAPATGEQVRRAVDGLVRHEGNRSIVTNASYVSSSDFNSMISFLAQGYPLLVGFNAHAYTITAISYHYDAYGQIVPDTVVLRDPWPSSPSRQEISYNTLATKNPVIIAVTISS